MHLSGIEVANYRSLESVTLDNLGRMNVPIGRNNVGKSSVFALLNNLALLIRGTTSDWVFESPLWQPDSALKLRLAFAPSAEERSAFLDLLTAEPAFRAATA